MVNYVYAASRSEMEERKKPKNVVIIGGGIMGCTTALYLSRYDLPQGITITVIEASKNGVAQGASGKAGGLVARWAYPKELVEFSFREHEQLADRYGGPGRWGWRYVNCGSWEGKSEAIGSDPAAGSEGPMKKSLEKTAGLDDALQAIFSRPRREKGLPKDLNWVKEELTGRYNTMAPLDSTAQVHPYLFTTSMMDLAKERGARLIAGKATSINQSDGRVISVTYIDNETQQSTIIPATDVVLCAGAWSASLVPELPMSATRAHSIVISPQPNVQISPYVLFTEIMLPSGETVTPEIYARPNNEVYACGPGDNSPLPATVDDVEVHKPACESLWERVAGISQELREGTVMTEQACYLPLLDTSSGPVIGELSKLMKGLFVATGHSCWGICNAPGTARIISDMIINGRSHASGNRGVSPPQVIPGMDDPSEK